MADTDLISAQDMSRTCRCLDAQRRARSLARRYDTGFRPLGLTSGQFSILAALHQPQPVVLTRLAEILGLERTTLTRNLIALEAAGLVASLSGDEDRRVRRLLLTAIGRAKLAAAMPVWHRLQGDVQAG